MSRSPRSPARLGQVAATDLLLLVILLLLAMRFLLPLLLGGLFVSGAPGQAPASNLIGMATVLLMMLQAAIVLGLISGLVLRRYGLQWADLGLLWPKQPWILRAVLLGLFCTLLAAFANAMVQQLMGRPLDNPQIQAIVPTAGTPLSAILMVLTASIIVPIAEEIAFRGLLYGWLRTRMSVRAAAVISAVCFACLHGVPALVPSLALIGLVLAWETERSGSVWPAIVMHGCFNLVMMLFLFLALSQGIAPPGIQS